MLIPQLVPRDPKVSTMTTLGTERPLEMRRFSLGDDGSQSEVSLE